MKNILRTLICLLIALVLAVAPMALAETVPETTAAADEVTARGPPRPPRTKRPPPKRPPTRLRSPPRKNLSKKKRKPCSSRCWAI